MTDYGRGPGSEPWHPEDPLYGDQGWQQHAQGGPHQQGPWEAYGTGEAGQYPQDPHQAHPGHPGQQAHQGQPGHGQYPAQQGYPEHHGHYGQQHGYPQGHYPEQSGWDGGAHQQHSYGDTSGYGGQQPYHGGQNGGYDGGYGGAGYGAGGYDGAGYDTGGYHAGGQPTAYDAQGYHGGGYDGGGYQDPGYGSGEQQQHPAPYPDEGRPQPGARAARSDPQEQGRPERDVDPETGWDPGPDQGEADFFNRQDDHDWDDQDRSEGEGRSGRGGGKPRKRRGGCACLGAAVLLLGVVGVGGYFGKQFYDSRFGAPEDFAGDGLDEEVQVEIEEGATLAQMGAALRDAGVVASVGAFTNAAEGESIQPGFYTLRLEMSAEAAVTYMTDPDTLNTLVIPEGMRTTAVYESIDTKLGLEEGSTADIAASGVIELPDWADSGDPDVKDPLEGFLFPARYDIGDTTDPEALLQSMVDRAGARFVELGVDEEAAAALDLDSARDIITVASLVQAEGMTYDDFQQMAEVVYNRMAPDNDVTNRKLEFDSSYNYLLGESKTHITEQEIHSNDDPYNTYYHTLLPPGPIGNPGEAAVEAALDPTEDGWMFFITLDDEETIFTATFEDHEELRDQRNQEQGIQGAN